MTDPRDKVLMINNKGGMLCNKMCRASRKRMKRTGIKSVRQDVRQRRVDE